jgi:hypothetical protein
MAKKMPRAKRPRSGKVRPRVKSGRRRMLLKRRAAARRPLTPEAREADRTRKIAIRKDQKARLAWRKARRAAEVAQSFSDLAARKQKEARWLGEAAVRLQHDAKGAGEVAQQALLRLAESMSRRR